MMAPILEPLPGLRAPLTLGLFFFKHTYTGNVLSEQHRGDAQQI